MQTAALQREMGLGMVRIALECDKRVEKDRTKVLEEPLWTMFCNWKKSVYGVRREANEEDFNFKGDGALESRVDGCRGAGVYNS
ncbi:hypothetical protein QQ045_009765 [Rhodiola kirilowii]